MSDADEAGRVVGFAGPMANPQTNRPPSLNKPESFVGSQVGRYTVVRHLASGGMAELFIAKQEAMGGFEKPVVLKLLQPRYAENPRVVSMFLDEARLAAKLNHPSIVHVYDVAEDGGIKYIAMEYIHGETVADIVKRGLAVNNYLPLEHAVHIVRQTAAGLGYAHERREPDGHVLRIVHRDVSPTNILVSYEGQTKIVDFGIARAQDELREESGTRPGKASYMSPEQVRGEPRRLSLGHLLAGHHPVRADALPAPVPRARPRSIMRKIVDEKVPPPTAINRDYPPTLELIVMRALEKRPEDRYQSAEEMRHDLEEFLEESGLRSGNRRVSLYMQELFAPDAPTSDAGVAASRVVLGAAAAGVRRRRRGRRQLGRAGSRSPRAAGDADRGCSGAGRARGARQLGRIRIGAGAGDRVVGRLGRRLGRRPLSRSRFRRDRRRIATSSHHQRVRSSWVIVAV